MLARQLGLLVLFGAGLTAAALPLAARQASPPQPIFRTGITHVVVDVIVTDKNDRPVTNLTADEFEIRDGGRPQTIADFEHISVPMGTRPIDLAADPGPPPDAFTNAPPGRSGRAFLFVLDDQRLDVADLVPIKRLMAEFLRGLSPDDEVALTYPNGRSNVSQDFTRDTGQIIRAINNLNASLAQPITRGGVHPKGWTPGQMLKYEVTALAAARENRRAVVFVSNGFPIDGRDPEILEAFDLAKHLDVPIYTIDPRGLMAPPLGLDGHIEDQTPGRVMRLFHEVQADQQGMRTIAENTNGLAFVNNSDLPRAIHELLADNGSYYLLGYYPSPYVADGKYHDIKVTVTRPGLRVRARTGYPTEKPRPANATPPRLVDSLGAALPGGDLLLRAIAAPLLPTSRGTGTLLTLDVTYPDAGGDAARADDELHLVWLAIDPDAGIRAKGQNTIRVPMAGAPRKAFTLSVDDLLDLPSGKLTIRIAVTSRLLGTQGTLHVPLDVSRLGTTTLDASALVIGLDDHADIRIATLGNPLAAAPFQPTTLRVFSTGTPLRVFSRVFARDATHVGAELMLKRDDVIIQLIPVRVAPSKSSKGALDCEATVATGDLPAGRYALVFTAQGAKNSVVRRSLAFDVK